MKVGRKKAAESLLKSIYQTDTLSEKQKKNRISQHIIASTGRDKVVPTAMLLATGKFDYSSTQKALDDEPIVRNIIQDLTG